MSRTETYELVAGKYVEWQEISRHGNLKACKPWGQLITDTHDKYGVDGEWLDKSTIDGKPHLNVSEIEAGDIIKVSGASHSNKKNAYFRVHGNGDQLIVKRISETEVIEELEGGRDDLDELRATVQQLAATCEDAELLETMREELKANTGDSDQ